MQRRAYEHGHNLAQRRAVAGAALALAGCLGAGSDTVDPHGDGGAPDAGDTSCMLGTVRLPSPALRINELSADNEGNWIDELGETDDWIELVNAGGETVELDDYRIADAGERFVPLPAIALRPGERVLLWADDAPAQGPLHLPFKLSAGGDRVELRRAPCELADEIELTPLAANETLARFPDATGEFARCRYASPGRDNGSACEPARPATPALRDYADYAWPEPFAAPRGPLVISELALRPAAFVELLNVSTSPQALDDFALELAPHGPGEAWPARGQGVALPSGAGTLQPGERATLEITEADVAALAADPAFEGVATLFASLDGAAVDRVDFMRWPDGATLARLPDDSGPHRYCRNASAGEANAGCEPLPSRDVGDRVRHLRTPGDYPALAEGAARLGMEAVKFLIDMQAGDVVHILSSRAWALHYNFVREAIDGEPPLDRCDPQQNAEFNAGWFAYSQREYFVSEGRRYLGGTLTQHGGSGVQAVEFSSGDLIAAEQVLHAFFTIASHLPDPEAWTMRPQGPRQVALADTLEGELPIVDENAPFVGLRYQPLTQTIGYGVLEFVPAVELLQARLGARTIVVTDDVPNDIPLVGGLITEAFQTPLAHVNVLSQNRDTPNMALRGARDHPAIRAHLGQLVRLSVNGGGFALEPADPAEAEAFWTARAPAEAAPPPRLDTAVRGVQPLWALDQRALPAVGAKAAQLAELMRVTRARAGCAVGPLRVPPSAFALPVVHSLEHQRASGAQALLEAMWNDPDLHADPARRAVQLREARAAIASHPVDPDLLVELSAAIRSRYGDARVRLRSSSNTEDLPGFNGAGLYTSLSAGLDDPERPLADALRGVWASLWNVRAYDERELARIDHAGVAMGVLVHPAYLSERASGVAVSRNVLDPIRGDMVYLNAQAGEASVTNPAPGIQTEELIYRWPPRAPEVSYLASSSLTAGQPVLSPEEARSVACAVGAIHDHFKPLLDPAGEDRLFAMEIEFKLVGETRELLVKQARPHPFGAIDIPADCREF